MAIQKARFPGDCLGLATGDAVDNGATGPLGDHDQHFLDGFFQALQFDV